MRDALLLMICLPFLSQRSSASPDRAHDRNKLGRSRSRSPETNNDNGLKRLKTEELVRHALEEVGNIIACSEFLRGLAEP